MKKICLVLPSLSSGGMERVMVLLANQFSSLKNIEVILLVMAKNERFYRIDNKVKLIEPDFNYRNYSRPVFTVKILLYVRRYLRELQPGAILTFGGKYNGFVLLAAFGLGLRVFVSDRSRPSISYGRFLDWFNPVIYRQATGIIAQTTRAKEFLIKKINHPNIRVIGNPIQVFNKSATAKENIILNIGRFIPSKQQGLLVELFSGLKNDNWRLVFLGQGAEMDVVKAKTEELGITAKVTFEGNVDNIESFYLKSKIFAFTSTSEGFPNALGEAMAAACACISFDCEAGPAELIDDGVNGFLVPVGDHETYKIRLQQLVDDETLRIRLGQKAREKMKQFNIEKIAKDYLNFILPESKLVRGLV